MRKLVCFSLMSLIFGLLSVHATAQTDNTEPFVGNWEYWEDNCWVQLDIDLYGTPKDGSYGTYNVSEDGYGLTYNIVEIYLINNTWASVAVEGGMGKQNAEFKYNPATREVTFLPPGSAPVVFKQKDKCGYIIVKGGDKVNVRSAPVSGTPLMKANRGQSFKFLGKDKGWFKVELSVKDKRVGYVSPEYASYLKDNSIPEEALTKEYSRDMTSFYFEKEGDMIFMTMTTMRPPLPDGGLPMAVVETYAGKVVGNALVFTYFGGMNETDVSQMTKIEPYVIYYWKESGIFIVEGKNFSPDM